MQTEANNEERSKLISIVCFQDNGKKERPVKSVDPVATEQNSEGDKDHQHHECRIALHFISSFTQYSASRSRFHIFLQDPEQTSAQPPHPAQQQRLVSPLLDDPPYRSSEHVDRYETETRKNSARVQIHELLSLDVPKILGEAEREEQLIIGRDCHSDEQ